MDFLALNDDVQFIISKHLQSDFKIRTMLSKYHDLQKILFGEIRMYACMYGCMYVYTCCVLTNPPIPSSRCNHFVVLRPV